MNSFRICNWKISELDPPLIKRTESAPEYLSKMKTHEMEELFAKWSGAVNPVGDKPIKWSNTLKRFVGNELFESA